MSVSVLLFRINTHKRTQMIIYSFFPNSYLPSSSKDLIFQWEKVNIDMQVCHLPLCNVQIITQTYTQTPIHITFFNKNQNKMRGEKGWFSPLLHFLLPATHTQIESFTTIFKLTQLLSNYFYFLINYLTQKRSFDIKN